MKVYVKDPNTDKLPWGPLLTVVCITFLDSFCLMLITPNLAFMVKYYYPELDDTEIGYYSGYLTAMYNIGGIPGSLFWGWYSDRFGRRTCFLSSLICVFICVNLFGLAPTFPLALILRCLWGFCNGNNGATKTYISEICNRKTQAMGFSLFITSFGIATALGPTIGGILSKPEENLQWLLRLIPYLKNIPFYIPCFVGSILVLIVFIMTAFLLPETLSKEMIKENYKKKNSVKMSIMSVEQKKKDNPSYKLSKEEIELQLWKKDNYFSLFTNKNVVSVALLYGFVSMIQLAQDSIYPIWLLMSKDQHGFELDQADIGILTSGNSLMQMLTSPILLPQFVQLMNYTDIFCVFSVLYGIALCLNPLLGYLSYADPIIQWYCTNILYSLTVCLRLLNFGSVIVLVNNATYANFRSKVNGIGQVFQAVGRSLGPIISSNLFAWSVSSSSPEFIDFGFSFYVVGILSFLSGFIAYILPKSINYPSETLQETAAAIYEQNHLELEENKVDVEASSIENKEDICVSSRTTKEDMKLSSVTIEMTSISNEDLEIHAKPIQSTSTPLEELTETTHSNPCLSDTHSNESINENENIIKNEKIQNNLNNTESEDTMHNNKQ